MGFTTPNFPRLTRNLSDEPLMERMKTLALNWVEYGYGAPQMVHTIYIVKLVLFYVLGGIVVPR